MSCKKGNTDADQRTLVAARDLSPLGIRVVTIAPGTFLTPAYGQAGDQLEAYWGPQVPFPKRMGRSPEYGASSTGERESTFTLAAERDADFTLEGVR